MKIEFCSVCDGIRIDDSYCCRYQLEVGGQ